MLLRLLPFEPRWVRSVAAVALLVPLCAARPGVVGAQDASCEFLEGTASFNMITLAGGATITYLGNPRIGCPDGVGIVADSAITYSAQDMTHLLGEVVFRDGTRVLEADEARYFPSTGRLQAQGEVRLENTEDGSVIENGDMILLRANDFREQDELTATTAADGVRPRATLFIRPAPDTAGSAADTAGAAPGEAPDSAGPATEAPDSLQDAPSDAVAVAPPAPDTTPPTPYEVEADRLHLVGQGYFEAVGNAVIDRDSIHATARRAEYNEAVGFLVLTGQARLEGSAYDLAGDEIVMGLPGGEIRQVTARRSAVLTGEEIHLDAPVIDVFLVDGLMDRLVAVPMRSPAVDSLAAPDSAFLAQPVATAQDFVLSADSLDVRAPAQELDRIWAVGAARGESTARDSINVPSLPEVARRDWIEGDTILATFRPDTSGVASGGDEYVLDELVASGEARSLYRLLPSDTTTRAGVDAPAVHYVTGSRITIAMVEGEVERMDVEGPTQGYHLEPVRRPAVSDSLADTLAAPADTVPAADTSGAAGGAGAGVDRGGDGPELPRDARVPATPGHASRGGERRRS